MTAVDTNILVFAHRSDSPYHQPARAWLRATVESPAAWALPWPCIHEFLSVVSNPRIFAENPTPPPLAVQQVDALLSAPNVTLLRENSAYWRTLKQLLEQAPVRGAKIHDARIYALCLAHGVRMLSTADRDFGQFEGLQLFDPTDA